MESLDSGHHDPTVKQKTASRVSVKARTLAHESYCGVLGCLQTRTESVSKCVDALAKHDEHKVDTWASVFHLGTGLTVREDGNHGIGCCCAPEFDGSYPS